MSEVPPSIEEALSLKNIVKHAKTGEFIGKLLSEWKTRMPDAEGKFKEKGERSMEVVTVPLVTMEELDIVERYLCMRLEAWRKNFREMVHLIVLAKDPPPLEGYKRVKGKIVPIGETATHATLETKTNVPTLKNEATTHVKGADSDPSLPPVGDTDLDGPLKLREQ